jgi:hypothetical protein
MTSCRSVKGGTELRRHLRGSEGREAGQGLPASELLLVTWTSLLRQENGAIHGAVT